MYALLHISILGRLKKEHLLWIFLFSSAPLWWGGARLHQTKTLGTVTSDLEDWKETVTFEHGEREKCEGAQMMPCNIDRGQHHAWVGRLEMGDAESLYTVCRRTSPSLRGESKEIVNAFFFPGYVFSSCAAYKSLEYTQCPRSAKWQKKKKHFKKLFKMIYEVSGFHKATSDKNLKYLVWLSTGNSSTSYFKF